jgi:hypothetical protein
VDSAVELAADVPSRAAVTVDAGNLWDEIDMEGRLSSVADTRQAAFARMQ